MLLAKLAEKHDHADLAAIFRTTLKLGEILSHEELKQRLGALKGRFRLCVGTLPGSLTNSAAVIGLRSRLRQKLTNSRRQIHGQLKIRFAAKVRDHKRQIVAGLEPRNLITPGRRFINRNPG